MRELGLTDFEDFFKALWDKQPFSWQRQLTKRVLDEREKPWPEVIALPTGSGKTACIDIAIFSLAAKVGDLAPGRPLSLPRRLFFTVDRRIIVDEAYARARHIAVSLRDASEGILKQVADRLRLLSGGDDETLPLGAYVLRGGMYRSEAWAESPTRPTIICTTVDQLGSRLLFRAYGRSFKAWPIHAGLVANDSLILLDEAHCARPLLQTLGAIRRYRDWAEAPLNNPFHVSVMSATPPVGMTDVFRDDSDERTNPQHPLGKRQQAAKPALLWVPVKATGVNATTKFARALAEAAEACVDETHKAIVVFCNRVATARAVKAILADSKKYPGHAILLTGRMRPIDKDEVTTRHLAELASNRSENRRLNRPLFVVATQTLEVGADLDFDGLVSECASLDALRQRFGRLNRMGRPITAKANILIQANQSKDSTDDPVYGAALANTWQWLQGIAQSNIVDFGIATLEAVLPGAETLSDLSVMPPLTPIMLPAHIDGWAQTAPQPVPTADVSLFLHGVQRGAADLQVCWRADIDLDSSDNANTEANEQAALETLSLVPPTTAECLPVSIATFRRWLSGQMVTDAGSDVEGERDETASDETAEASPRSVIRWRNRNEMEVIDDPRGLRPGDVIVIPGSLRDSLTLGDIPTDAKLDIADRATLQTRAKAVLRLHAKLMADWPQSESTQAIRDWLPDGLLRYEEDPTAVQAELVELLKRMALELPVEAPWHWLKTASGALADDKRIRLAHHPSGGFIVKGSALVKSLASNRSFGDEDDASASGTVRVALPMHLCGVGEFAERFAKSCGLPESLVEALRCAGRLHDLGKADPRFQALLNDGNPWICGPLLAKSANVPRSRARFKLARETAGYPEHGRHELLSVRLAEAAPELLPDDSLLRDLVLHLVASHHGHCRPFAPVIVDTAPRHVALTFDGIRMEHSSDTQLERLDSGVSDRYWRLTRHFGWWGLAWLESILRLADHRRSEWEGKNQGRLT